MRLFNRWFRGIVVAVIALGTPTEREKKQLS